MFAQFQEMRKVLRVLTTQPEDLVPEMSTEESTSERLRYDLTTSAESGEYICCYKFKYITFHVIFKDCFRLLNSLWVFFSYLFSTSNAA